MSKLSTLALAMSLKSVDSTDITNLAKLVGSMVSQRVKEKGRKKRRFTRSSTTALPLRGYQKFLVKFEPYGGMKNF